MAKQIDTTVEIERAYIKDQITYQKVRNKKTTYFYDIAAQTSTNGKLMVALVYPFNYNATPYASKKPEFNVSWGDGTETTIRNKFVDMFDSHFSKVKPFTNAYSIDDIKLFSVVEKVHGVGEKLYHEYELNSDGTFKVNGKYILRMSIESEEIVVPFVLNANEINNLYYRFISGSTINAPLPLDENVFVNYNSYTNSKAYVEQLSNCISLVICSVGGEYPPNLIGLSTDNYKDEFSKVFKRGIYHPLDQKISHIKNGIDGIDDDIMSSINTNDSRYVVDYKSPSSMSMYALAGNNRFINKELLESIGTPNQHPIPIQACLCSGVFEIKDNYYYQRNKNSKGFNINPLLTPALINKGININNSILRISIVTSSSDSSKVHLVFNPYQSIIKVFPDTNGEFKLFSNTETEEIWGFFCNFYRDWRYRAIDGTLYTSPWLYDTNGIYDLFRSLPATVKSMKCVYRVHQSYVDNKLYSIRNEHRILDAIPKSVQDIENLVVFSNLEFYKKGFRVYRDKQEYNELESYNGGFRMLPFDNDDGVSNKYKNSDLKIIKNMVFCCDLYPEPLGLGDNAWTTNFDGVSILYGFNNLEKVDGVFTYCRFKDVGYMRIRDLCQRPTKDKYEDPDRIDFKLIELSRVIHWCDVINELSEDGDTNEHALNPFNGHMVEKQRSSWNVVPSYKYRDFYNAMTGDSTYRPDKQPCFIFGKTENELDFKHMGFSFMFLERKAYPDDRIGGIIDQNPIFKSVTDFAHGYMNSYSYINSELPQMTTKTIKIDGYIQAFQNHQLLYWQGSDSAIYNNIIMNKDFNFSADRNSVYLRAYLNGFFNLRWNTPIGWMFLGNTIDDNKLIETSKKYVKNTFKPAIVDMSNIEGLFANVGALACDMTPMSEVEDSSLFLSWNLKLKIDNNIKTLNINTHRFGLYSYNEDDILIKTTKNINIKRLFQNETYYGALATDHFYQAKSKYPKWFADETIYRENELNKTVGYENALSYNMTTFKNYNGFKGSDYKDRIISMGTPSLSNNDKFSWTYETGATGSNIIEYSFVRRNCALGSEERFNSVLTNAHDDNLLNWCMPPLTTGYKYRYPTLFNYINQQKLAGEQSTDRFTMNTHYPRAHQGANFLITKGKFIVNTNNSSVDCDYAFDGMILVFGLNKSIIHKDFIISSMKGITTKNTIGVIKHNCDWNFKDENVIGYIPTISRTFVTTAVGEPFTNLKYVIPKRIVPNMEEFNEMVAIRLNSFNSYEISGVVNAMIVPKIASTPSRYRKFDNIHYKFKGKDSVEFDEFNYVPTNVVDYNMFVSHAGSSEQDIFGISHVRKLFPDDVDVHIKNFKMPYMDNIDKFKYTYDKTKSYGEMIFNKDNFIIQSVPLKYALNGAIIDNLEEVEKKWKYIGTPIIFKSAKLIDGEKGSSVKCILRCPYNVDLTSIDFNLKVLLVHETDWGRKKVNEKNIMITPTSKNNPVSNEFTKITDTDKTTVDPELIPSTSFQPPIREVLKYDHMGPAYATQFLSYGSTNDHENWSCNDNFSGHLFPTSHARKVISRDFAIRTSDENMGGTSRWVNQNPKWLNNFMKNTIVKYPDRIEFTLTRIDLEFSIMILSDIPLWLEESDYITGEFPPYSDYSERYPIFKTTPFDENHFKTYCFDKQMKGFEIDDVFLEIDDHFKHTSALLQIDNNDLGIPHRVNPFILEPTTYKDQTKFGEVINVYGRKFPIVNFRWTLGFAFSNLPKTVTEVDGFNFADTVYVPDKCIPEQITKFHFHKELLEPNQAYKEGIIDAVLWFNKPFMNENIEMVNSVEYFSNIMLFTRRKDNLSNNTRTQMEEYYEWSTDNKITLGPVQWNEGFSPHWKSSISIYGNSSINNQHINLACVAPEPNYYEMRRNYNKWVVADRNVNPDDIITVKWVIRFQSKFCMPLGQQPLYYDATKVIMNSYITTGNTRFDMSEDVVTYTGKVKDLPNFSVFDYNNIKSARNLYKQHGLPTIKSIRIYGDVYVCPAINWERGLWGVLRGTLPSGTDTRCVPIPQRCYEGIFYRDVKLHGIITGEYDGSLPEKLFWGTRNENLRINGLYCSTRYANPHSWHTRKRNIRKPYTNTTTFGTRNQDNMLAYIKDTFKVVTDNLDATLNNLFYGNENHNIYNRLTGNNLFVPNLYGNNTIFPMITSDMDENYPSTIENIYNISYSTITNDMIKSDNNAYAPLSLFYPAGFADRFNYKPVWTLNGSDVDNNQEIAYSLDFSRGAFSNVHDASPLSIPHKIDELDVSYLGGFGDLYDVYTDDVFGFTEPNLYNLNYTNFQKPHMEKVYKIFGNVDHTTNGGVWGTIPRPSYPCVPVSSFFGKWFMLNGVIKTKDNSNAYVFSDHRIGPVMDFDAYSPHRFDQTTFDQSIYVVQNENIQRSSIYRVRTISRRMPNESARFYMDLESDLNYYNNIIINLNESDYDGYYSTGVTTHGGIGAAERYSRSSIYYPSNLISETVGSIVETGYTPIMSSLMKLIMLKYARNEINNADILYFSSIPKECLCPQGYQTNWSVADEASMKCRSLVLKRLSDFNDETIIRAPKWYSDNMSQSTKLLEYGAERFKYQPDILENENLKVSVITCEPTKNMLMRLNGKRRIKLRYGRIRNVDYAGVFWITPTNGAPNENHMIYQRAIPGINQLMYYRNSAYSGRIENMRNLTHWASGGFNYGLIDDTGMTQYIDTTREIFIESETGWNFNQMFIGCHPHLKEVKIVNGAASEVDTNYLNKIDKVYIPSISDIFLEANEGSQHPSYNQTSPNCYIRETLPYQPCLTKIINCCTSPLSFTVGETSLTHIMNFCSRAIHGRKFGRSAIDWTFIAGEEQKMGENMYPARLSIFSTYKIDRFVPSSTFTGDPISQISSYCDVIVDNKWINRKMNARKDIIPSNPKYEYNGIYVQGHYFGVWKDPFSWHNGGAPDQRDKFVRYFDSQFTRLPSVGGIAQVNTGTLKSFEYGTDEIANLHKYGYNRKLIQVSGKSLAGNNELLYGVRNQWLSSQMGQVGDASNRASGNPYHNSELKLFLSHTFAHYLFDIKPDENYKINLHDICDSSILSSGNANKTPEGIIVADDYRFSNIFALPGTLRYGNQTPVVYCHSQRGWFLNHRNGLDPSYWEWTTDALPTDYTKPLLWLLEGDADITDFYKNEDWLVNIAKPDLAKMSYYSVYTDANQALSAFENSIIRFNKSNYPITDNLNITNAFYSVRLRWFDYDLSKPAYKLTLDKYKPNVANYVRDNFDRLFFAGKLNITGKSGIKSTVN